MVKQQFITQQEVIQLVSVFNLIMLCYTAFGATLKKNNFLFCITISKAEKASFLSVSTSIVSISRTWYCCRKGNPSNTQKWIVWGDTCADKARDFIGKGHLGREQEGQGTEENCSATWLSVSGFMVMGLASGLSLVNHSDSESFLVVHALFSQDGCQWEGFWEVVGHVVSLLTFPELSLLVGVY